MSDNRHGLIAPWIAGAAINDTAAALTAADVDYTATLASVDSHRHVAARLAEMQAMIDLVDGGARAFLAVDGSPAQPMRVPAAMARSALAASIAAADAEEKRLAKLLKDFSAKVAGGGD